MITWDCRGFGNSTFTSSVFGSAAAVADMSAVLDATGTPGAHLVGQSMGGWSVLEYALAHRDKVKALVLSATSGTLDRRSCDHSGGGRHDAWAKEA